MVGSQCSRVANGVGWSVMVVVVVVVCSCNGSDEGMAQHCRWHCSGASAKCDFDRKAFRPTSREDPFTAAVLQLSPVFRVQNGKLRCTNK